MGELTGGMGVLESGVEYRRVNRGDGSNRIRGRICAILCSYLKKGKCTMLEGGE